MAVALLERVPLPTSAVTLQNLTSIEKLVRDVDQVSLRIDQRVGESDQLFARFSTFDADEVQPFGTSALQETLLPGFGRTLGTKTRNLGASYTHVFSPAVVHETRFGWMRTSGGQASQNRGVDFASEVGLQGVSQDPRDVGFPQISTRGLYSAFGDPTSFVYRNNEHFELYQNLTVDRGLHRLKFGGYFFHLQFRPNSLTTRGARSPTRVSFRATRLPISCLAIQRLPSRGSDGATKKRADELAAPVTYRTTGARVPTSPSTSGCATNTTSTCGTRAIAYRRSTT